MALNNIASSLKLMHLSLLLVTLSFVMCSGIFVHITGSSEFAVLSKPFTFTCTATEVNTNKTSLISFYRITFGKLESYATLIQNQKSCSVFSPPYPGFGKVSCGLGTNMRQNTTKKYLLEFNVTVSHLTVWFCALDNNVVFSNNFTLQVKGKVHVNSAAEPPITDPFTLPIVFTVAQLVIGALPTFL